MTTTTPATSRRSAAPKTPLWVFGVAGVVVFLLLLELAPKTGIVDQRFLPPADEIFSFLRAEFATEEFWRALGFTVVTWIAGLAIAVAAGVVLGGVFGLTPVIWRFVSSTVEFLRPVPSVALIPVAMLMFGTKVQATLLLVVFAAVWPILVAVISGVADVDPIMRDTVASYRFSWRSRLTKAILPTALPYAITGFRLSASTALIITVTGELLISLDGIGGLFEIARNSGDYAGMYGYAAVAGILGLVVNLGVRGLERVVLFWHPSVRKEAA